MARTVGFDDRLLEQRRAFLRPDSLVAIVLLTDEDESNLAPLALGGKSWRFTSRDHLKPGTTACETEPMSGTCVSCLESVPVSDPACGRALDDATDHMNLRFFEPKRRFGVDPRYPVERYVRGLSQARVPTRDDFEGDHYVDREAAMPCQNPLFAAQLPASSRDEWCKLPAGPRTAAMVHFLVLGGVPWQLLTSAPEDLSEKNPAPLKSELEAADWRRLLGDDALAYRNEGQHPLMRESTTPRLGAAPDGAHLRDYQTGQKFLQYACAFPLPAPRDCNALAPSEPCDCRDAGDAPICDPKNRSLQTHAAAFPTLRALALAKGLGKQGLVGSVCPSETQDATKATFGYGPVLDVLADRLGRALR